MGDHNEGSWILRLLFWGQIAKIGKFPSHQDLKNKNCRLFNCTLFSLILFCRKSNEKQIIGHYLAPPLNLTCKVPMFIEQSFALTLASFVSKSPLSQKKKKNSHPPLVWSDLIMALQNPRLEKIIIYFEPIFKGWCTDETSIMQVQNLLSGTSLHHCNSMLLFMCWWSMPDHYTFLGKCTPTPPLSQH